MKKDFTYREIPYNYTSFSDREIVLKYFDEETWELIEILRKQRVTGRSAKLLFEILGDIFIIDRNPYIFNDFIEHPKKQRRLQKQHDLKLNIIDDTNNPRVHNLIKRARAVDMNFLNHSKKKRGTAERFAWDSGPSPHRRIFLLPHSTR